MAPSSIYEQPDPLPEINDSVNEPVNDDVGDVPIQVSDELQPSMSTRGTTSSRTIAFVFKQPKPKTGFKQQPLCLTIGGKKYKLVKEQESVGEILTTPKAKVSRMGGAHMQGLPNEEIDKHKKECVAKAEEKRVAKQQTQAMQSLR